MMPTPTDPPMVRLNWTRPVATARRSHSTAPWMTTSSVVDIRPMPTPVTKHASIANGSVPTASSCVSSSDPTSTAAAPVRTMGRARVRSRIRPAITDAIGQPMDIADTAAPASSADPPWTPWIIGGTYVVWPNITTPARMLMPERDADQRRPHEVEVDQRRRRPSDVRHERGEQRRGADEHRDHDGRRPAEQLTALRHREQQQHDRAGQERRAQPVDRLPMALELLVEREPDDQAGQDADRQIDHEHPRPAHRGRDDRADRRADRPRTRPTRRRRRPASWPADAA